MNDVKKIFGYNIRRLRNTLGLTQEEFSLFVGIEFRTIANLETGRNIANSTNLQKLCDKLKVHPIEFFERIPNNSTESKRKEIESVINKTSKNEIDAIYKFLTAIKR